MSKTGRGREREPAEGGFSALSADDDVPAGDMEAFTVTFDGETAARIAEEARRGGFSQTVWVHKVVGDREAYSQWCR
jgi:hypothetical protein